MSDHILAFIGFDLGTMHLKISLSQPDRAIFIKATEKEFEKPHQLRTLKKISSKNVSRDKIPLPTVWSMKKRGPNQKN